MQKSITMESMFLMVLVQALGRERRFVKEVIKKALYIVSKHVVKIF